MKPDFCRRAATLFNVNHRDDKSSERRHLFRDSLLSVNAKPRETRSGAARFFEAVVNCVGA